MPSNVLIVCGEMIFRDVNSICHMLYHIGTRIMSKLNYSVSCTAAGTLLIVSIWGFGDWNHHLGMSGIEAVKKGKKMRKRGRTRNKNGNWLFTRQSTPEPTIYTRFIPSYSSE